jgi:enoyl-CoA hydratase
VPAKNHSPGSAPSTCIAAESAAPLGVKAVLASAHLARDQGDAVAIERLRPDVTELFSTADAAEGVRSFVERRPARFTGH